MLEIARFLVGEIAREEGRPARRLAADAEAAILRHPWPGNVRQLQNVLRAMVIFAEGEELGAEDLPEPVRAARSPAAEDPASGRPRPIPVPSAGAVRRRW